MAELIVDGRPGFSTYVAILAFQKNVMGVHEADSMVDPHGPTSKEIAKSRCAEPAWLTIARAERVSRRLLVTSTTAHESRKPLIWPRETADGARPALASAGHILTPARVCLSGARHKGHTF